MVLTSSFCCGSGVNVELSGGGPWLPAFLLDSPPTSGEAASLFQGLLSSAIGISGLPRQTFLGPFCCRCTLNAFTGLPGLKDLALSLFPLSSPLPLFS